MEFDCPSGPVDDVATFLLVTLRAAAPKIVDHVWVRLTDVPRTLVTRTYSSDLASPCTSQTNTCQPAPAPGD